MRGPGFRYAPSRLRNRRIRPHHWSLVRYRARVRLTHALRIFRQQPRSMPRLGRDPRGAAARELGLVEYHIDALCIRIDADAVAVLHHRERPADGRFRRDMPDADAARRPGEAPVGHERDFLAHLLPVDQGGDAEHFAHAGPAARTLLADHEHVAGFILTPAHRGGAILF